MAARKTPARSRTAKTREELQSDLDEVREQIASQASVDPTSAAAARARAEHIRSTTGAITVDKVVSETTNLSLILQRALNQVNEQLVQKTQELAELKEAVELEREELQRLHSIDAVETNLAALVQEFDQKNKTLELEYEQKRALLAGNQVDAERRFRDEQTALLQQRKRETEEYEYQKKVERARAEQEFQAKMDSAARQALLKAEDLEKGWKAREAAISAQEEELQTLRTRVAGFEAELAKHAEAKVAIATNSLKKDLSHDFAIQRKDLETQLQIQVSRHQDQQRIITAQEQQIQKLQTALEDANKKIESIAGRAIDGAASRDAFERLRALQPENQNGPAARGKS